AKTMRAAATTKAASAAKPAAAATAMTTMTAAAAAPSRLDMRLGIQLRAFRNQLRTGLPCPYRFRGRGSNRMFGDRWTSRCLSGKVFVHFARQDRRGQEQ